LWKEKRFTLRLPLYYKFEKRQPTFEPRLYYNFKKFKIWTQTEFAIDERKNTAFAIDIPYENYSFRFGWDTSDTFRFAISVKL